MEKVFLIHPQTIDYHRWRIKPEFTNFADRVETSWLEAVKIAANLVVLNGTAKSRVGADRTGSLYVLKWGDMADLPNYANTGDCIAVWGAFREICVDYAASQLARVTPLVTIPDDHTLPKYILEDQKELVSMNPEGARW